MLCSVLDIRSRLGTLMSDILTDDVARTYAVYRSKTQESPEDIINRCAGQTDNLVQKLSACLSSPERIASLMQSASPDVIFTFFVRYHLLTQYLVSHTQDAPANVPEGSSAFFQVMMTDFWRFSLS